MSEPAAEPRPSPDPNYILSQAEFHGRMDSLQAGLDARLRLSQDTARREADGLRETAGWIAVSFALWLLLIGYALISGNVRGRHG